MCPQCGYDLRGIPEERCPECGYGFDRAAIRSLARADNWRRDSAYRRAIVWAVLSTALLASPLCEMASLSYLASRVAATVTLLAGIGLKWFYSDVRAPGASGYLEGVDAGCVLVVLWFGDVLVLHAKLTLCLATAALVYAWMSWASLRFRSPFTVRTAKPDDRALLAHRSRLAAGSLAGASLLILFFWWVA
ncbi:MAG: hypothetical protein ACYSUI_16535 [Planctomycetota bacterium]